MLSGAHVQQIFLCAFPLNSDAPAGTPWLRAATELTLTGFVWCSLFDSFWVSCAQPTIATVLEEKASQLAWTAWNRGAADVCLQPVLAASQVLPDGLFTCKLAAFESALPMVRDAREPSDRDLRAPQALRRGQILAAK